LMQNIKYLIPIIIISIIELLFVILSEMKGPFYLKSISIYSLFLLLGSYCCINSVLFNLIIKKKIKILYLIMCQLCNIMIVMSIYIISQF
jgi:hypothetical protein